MRRLRTMAMLWLVCALCACSPILPGNGLPASANSTASPAATMEQQPVTQVTAATAADAEISPSASATPAATLQPAPSPTDTPDSTAAPTANTQPATFESSVADGLNECWAGSQAIVVKAASETSATAELWLFERTDGQWKVAAGPWDAVVGRNGVTKSAEGDGKSPSGAFLLGTSFGWAAKPTGMTYQYRKLDGSDLWVDSTSSPFYNNWVHGSEGTLGSGENLSQVEQYKHALVVHYNDEKTNGGGSAIFIHVWRGAGQGTSGCTAISDAHMTSLLKWLDYSKRPVLVQGTGDELTRLFKTNWNMLCLPEGWGFADDFMQDAQLEIRYNTANNFTGKKVPGYAASLAPMRMDAINALAGAATELRAKKIGMRFYDAYRPQKATDAMVAWAGDLSDTSTKKEYYPDIDKADIPGNFVARNSAHKLGGTIDLTLLNWKDGKNIDMGGPFDFFGALSAYNYNGLTSKQAANRMLLRNIMIKYGFKPYDKEWWHFTFPVDGTGGTFLILPRAYVIK